MVKQLSFCILLTFMATNNIKCMENITERIPQFMDLPDELKVKVLLDTFEDVGKKKLSPEDHLKLVFKLRSDFIKTNTYFRDFLSRYKSLFFRKFADELRKNHSVDELNKLWTKFYNNEDVAAVLLYAGATDIYKTFEGIVDTQFPLQKNIYNLIQRRNNLVKTIKSLQTQSENLKDLININENKIIKKIAKELKLKYRFADLQLQWRSFLNNSYVVKVLVAAGVNTNEGFMCGETALLHAARGAHLSTMKFLISRQADVNAKDIFGTTPLLGVINAQIRKPEPGQLSTIQDIDPELKKEGVLILLNAGADPNIKNSFGNTPLDYARKNKLKEIEQILVDKGAKSGAELVRF